MLKEFLSKIKKTPPQQNPEEKNLSPNLLNSRVGVSNPTATILDRLFEFTIDSSGTTFFKSAIIFVEALYLFILVLNSRQTVLLSNLQKTILREVDKVNTYSGLKKRVDYITRKTNLYKQYQRPAVVSGRMESILAPVPEDIRVASFSMDVDGNTANIFLNVDAPLSISLLISDYLRDKSVSEIAIESAVLDPFTRTFNVNLNVMFRN